MKRLLIHIGTGKTGTSSIQNFLYANRKKLADHFSFYYAEVGLTKINHFGEKIYAHYQVVAWIKERKTNELEKLRLSLKASSCKIAVISCENLYHHLSPEDIGFLSAVFKEFSVEIICYVRRQDLYMESAWKQQVKVGALNIPFPEFLKQHTQVEQLETVHGNYYKKILPWSVNFGVKALKVRVFDKSEWVNGDLLDDFLYSCGVEDEKASLLLEKFQLTNTALPSELIMLVRNVNATHLIPKNEQQKFVNFLNDLNIFKEKSLLSSADRLAIIENYRIVNESLFSEYCNRQVPECFKSISVKDFSIETNSLGISVEDMAVRAIASIWKQSSPHLSLKINQLIQTVKEKGIIILKRLLSYFIMIRNKIQAKGYEPQALDPNKKNQVSPFVWGGKQSSKTINDYQGFYYYGFSQLPILKTELVAPLPHRFITVHDCFISAASRNTQSNAPRALSGALYENGHIIRAASFRGPGQLKAVNPSTVDQARISRSRLIPGTCVYMGWLIRNFGHLLLEAPARFWILDSINVANSHFIYHPLNYERGISGGIPIKTVIKDSFTKILWDSFGIHKEQIILADQDLCAEEIIIPSPLFFINQTIDPSQLSIYNKIKTFSIQHNKEQSGKTISSEVSTNKKIYLSRRLLKKAGQNRKAKNENVIEQLFISYGFEVVYPEQLPFQEQVRLLSNADIVAGCEGSALHMGVFLPASSKMIILTTRGIATNQLLISALGNIETHFIHAGKDRSVLYTTGNWEADITFIKEKLEKILNCPNRNEGT